MTRSLRYWVMRDNDRAFISAVVERSSSRQCLVKVRKVKFDTKDSVGIRLSIRGVESGYGGASVVDGDIVCSLEAGVNEGAVGEG
jgi:hypothetical protein